MRFKASSYITISGWTQIERLHFQTHPFLYDHIHGLVWSSPVIVYPCNHCAPVQVKCIVKLIVYMDGFHMILFFFFTPRKRTHLSSAYLISFCCNYPRSITYTALVNGNVKYHGRSLSRCNQYWQRTDPGHNNMCLSIINYLIKNASIN